MIKYIDPTNKILNPFDRSVEPAAGDRGWGSFGEVKTIDKENRRVYAVLSSSAIDRYGEIVDPRGFEPWMKRFMDNPVFLKDHDHQTQIGHWEGMKLTDTTFEGWAVFANTPTAEEQWVLYRDGHRKAFSVGFLGHKWEMREVKGSDGKMQRVRVFTSQEPIEGSGVAVPANHEALARVASLVAAGLSGDRTKSVAFAWADGPDELAAFFNQITTTVQQTVEQVFENRFKAIEIEPATLQQGPDLKAIITEILTDPLGPIQDVIRDVVAACGQQGHHCGTDVEENVTGASGDDDNERLIRKLDEAIASLS